ncbi:MAG: carboxypeptidase regulatory-like domain-containing protein [Candidatus Kerfeldbacteria bacterium]|nr:carboxypeptidase regulatory-like domain-containing protein [Candidatus Kerfeldbacteria bacterium]
MNSTSKALKITATLVGGLVMAVFVWISYLPGPETAMAVSGVSGTVQKPDGTTLAEEVDINCFGQTGGNGTKSATNGTFNLSLNAGHYKCQARPLPTSTFSPSTEVDIDVYPDQSTTFNPKVTNAQLKGRCLKPDGVTGVRCNINVHSQDFSVFAHANADDSGNYKLGGLAAGTYVAEAMPDFNVSGLTPPASENVTLGNTVVEKNFIFVGAAKTITGKVMNSSGAAAQANVNAFKPSGGGWANAHTDVNGNYTLSVSGGTWNVQPMPDPGADWIYSDPPPAVSFAEDATAESKTVNFTVQTTSSKVVGCIKDKNGAAVTSGNVDVRTQDGRGSGTPLGADGCFSVNVTPGVYNLFLWTPLNDKTIPPTSVTVGDNQTVTVNLVTTAKEAKIRGRVATSGGAAAGNVEVNANMMMQPGTGGGPGGWSNARTDSSGNYELAVTAGTWGVHLGMSPDSNFVPTEMKPCDISVPTDTSVVTSSDYSCLNMTVQQADATITGRVMDADTLQPVTNFPGCAFARAVGSFSESCSPINNGTFTIKVATTVATQWEVGCHTPPNSDRSCSTPQKVTVAANGTAQVDLQVVANNSSISGKIVDSSGFPISNCSDFRGMVFADAIGVGAHYQGEVKSDCTYKISLVAGSYQIGTNFDPKSGVMNKPPSPEDQVLVLSGQNVERNITIAKADAKITGVFLGPDGKPTQGFVFAENRDEIRESRELRQGEPGKGPGPGTGKGADIGFNKKMPCGATDIDGVIKCCSDSKNKTQCEAFPVPDGPNGCKNAYSCVQQCKSDPTICKDAQEGQQPSGPRPGDNFVGPGGCKSETECKTYCSKPENFSECSKFKPPEGALNVRIGTKRVAALATSPGGSSKSPGPGGPAGFDNAIRAGGPTGPDGKFELNVLSGHVYKVGGGLDPRSGGMPPKEVTCELNSSKTCNVVLQARTSDATIEGKVTIGKNPADRCFVHSWANDGSFSGTPCNPGGQYKLNITKGTTWHVGADSVDGSTFYGADEQSVVVTTEKKVKLDIALEEGKFRVPQPVTANFDCTTQTSVALDNGTTLNVPASAITTDSGTCSITATPTVDTGSTSGGERVGVAYEVTARDENGQTVTDLQQPVTFKIVLEDEGLAEEGIDDTSALGAASYDDSTGSYTNESDATVSELDNGDVAITFSADHFSAYTALNSGGSSAKLKTVSVSTNKKTKKTSFTVGSKKVTPFTKGTVTVKTALVGKTQVIVAGSDADNTVKIYSTAGKLTQKITAVPAQSLILEDLSKDGKKDLIIGSAKGLETRVYDLSKGKAKSLKVNAPAVKASGTTKTVAAAMDLGTGTSSLVVAYFDAANKPIGNVQVYSYKRGGFKTTKSSLASYLKAKSGTISFSVPAPVIKSLSPTSVSSSNSSAKLTLKGKNFEPNTSVQVCDTGALVTFKSTTQLNLVLDATGLTAGKCNLIVTNSNGDGALKSKYVTVE